MAWPKHAGGNALCCTCPLLVYRAQKHSTYRYDARKPQRPAKSEPFHGVPIDCRTNQATTRIDHHRKRNAIKGVHLRTTTHVMMFARTILKMGTHKLQRESKHCGDVAWPMAYANAMRMLRQWPAEPRNSFPMAAWEEVMPASCEV